jgi:DNA helicase-2/ATP-dependent DNA helicase PcrA
VAHAAYVAALRERGLVDVDELVALPASLLDADPALAGAYRERWTDVFVDEYQDVDEQQYRLLCKLASPSSRICAIGDPDQAIYGFRGGDVGYFLRFAEDFGAGSATTVRLSRSYRSAPTIVRAAMQLIRPGTLVPGRELVPARTDIPDGPVAVRAVADERAEAEAVAAEMERLLGATSFHSLDSRAVDGRDRTEHQLSFADFAVLYRTSAQAVAVGEALARRGFPFQRRSHTRLARMPGAERILAWLPAPVLAEAVPDAAPANNVSGLLTGAVTAALGAVTLAAGSEGDRERAETIAAIKAAADVLGPLAERCGTDLDRFLDELALGAEVDTWDPRADRISLLTLHAAKGLEFPVVFIVGCDDGLLPLRSWRGADVDYGEERRLLFVGMTRATTRLTLLTAAKRMVRGELAPGKPSPFLSSVDPALLDRQGSDSNVRARRRTEAQPTLF